jgi:hypothetical protein
VDKKALTENANKAVLFIFKIVLNEREMQPKRRGICIKRNSLPCAGITLIRFNGYNLSLLGTPGIQAQRYRRFF